MKELLEIHSVSFPLPLSIYDKNYYLAYKKLVGGLKTKKPRAAVYIFTHKETGQKYIGSSVNIARRLQKYWNLKYSERLSGLFLLLVAKKG